MPKWSIAVVSFAGLGAALVACAHSVETEDAPDAGVAEDAATDDGALTDTGADSGKDSGKPPVDSGGVVVDSGPSSPCYRPADVVTIAFTAVKAGQALCTTLQINNFNTLCLGPAATVATCNPYQTNIANRGCLSCLIGGTLPAGGVNPNLPALLQANTAANRLFADIPACGYVAIGMPACALPEAKAQVCAYSTCDTCATTEAAKCQTIALASGCTGSTVTCTNAFTANKTLIDTFCRGTTFTETYTKVASFLCGS